MPKRSCDNGGSGGICLVHDGQEGCVEAATASTLRVRHRSEREEREREERALLGTTVHNGGSELGLATFHAVAQKELSLETCTVQGSQDS
jgi:hypothetical protein